MKMSSAARKAPLGDADGGFAADMIEGLRKSPKSLPSKYFYDRRGSELFDRICELPEYYLTRTETALLRKHAAEIAGAMGRGVTLVEFGAGSLNKAAIVLDSLDAPRLYMPIDISGEHLFSRAKLLAKRYPGLAVLPVVADFTAPLQRPKADGRLTGFFPGSTIGNFEPSDALAFLKRAAALFKGSGLLVGVDLVKDPAILHAAYNDAAAITAAFNKNILARANRELDAGFDIDKFAHYAFYNLNARRIEMHLMALTDQHARIGDADFALREGDSIQTENSYKYTLDEFHNLARAALLRPSRVWCDTKCLFSLHWLEA